MYFISAQKLFSFRRYLKKFCSDLFGYAGKKIDKKAKIIFKIYEVT